MQALHPPTVMAPEFRSHPPLRAIVEALDGLGDRMEPGRITEILGSSALAFADVESLVKPCAGSYCRQRVARSDTYEVLLMTWLPGQATGAHDHAGSVSVFKILSGTALETSFLQATDSLVDPVGVRELRTGEVGIDHGDTIHAIYNAGPGHSPVVSLHVYSPPMPELRRFTIRGVGHPPAAAFARGRASASTPVVAIVGGGFSGSMVAAQVARRASLTGRPMHLVMVDRQPSIAEGTAYRTCDAGHLLNVPARAMSAWPDRPDDLLDWARRRDPSVGPDTFLERRAYGEYLRDTLFAAATNAGPLTSCEIRRDEATALERRDGGGWRLHCASGGPIDADAVVLATGHRAVADPLARCWSGIRTRYIEEPWSSMALSSIAPGESVCLLGTGLTAIDVLRSLNQPARRAPIVALSRRGLLPSVHAPAPLPSIDPLPWLGPLLHGGRPRTLRRLVAELRAAAARAAAAGQDWRQVIDGLRPHISGLWNTLSPAESDRFLRHARPFWEVARHRMAPSMAAVVWDAEKRGIFRTAAARVEAAHGAHGGVSLTVRRRGESAAETLAFDWVVNCTGPASGRGVGLPQLIRDLIDAGYLEEDARGLGVCSSTDGQALAGGRTLEDLLVVGSLRKADLWESTAVPELRVQAAGTAETVMNLPTMVAAWAGCPHAEIGAGYVNRLEA